MLEQHGRYQEAHVKGAQMKMLQTSEAEEMRGNNSLTKKERAHIFLRRLSMYYFRRNSPGNAYQQDLEMFQLCIEASCLGCCKDIFDAQTQSPASFSTSWWPELWLEM
jgi:hypothetical protein